MPLGLSDYWEELLLILARINEIYEEANKAMTLFTLDKMRESVGYILNKSRGVILDAGAGPGVMFKYVAKRNSKINYYVAIDPLKEMLKHIHYDNERIDRVLGVFEYLPFRNECINACITTFSFRDALDYVRAMYMLHQSLKNGGIYVLLDLYKSTNRLGYYFRKTYFSIVPKIVGAFYLGKLGIRLYSGLAITYDRFFDVEELIILAKKVGFKKILVYPLFKMAIILVAFKYHNHDVG